MARDRDNIRRDLAGIGPDPRMAGQLHRMRDVGDFRIADGEPDIRGWEVRTLAGMQVGEVDDLLIDPHRGEVVMIDVDLSDSDQHVNVPIRGVQLDRSRKYVIVDSGDIRSARDSILNDDVDPDVRRDDVRGIDATTNRDVRYGAMREDTNSAEATEEVIERRPVIEEVVVRRRVLTDDRTDGTD